jgi:hypothetical protein
MWNNFFAHFGFDKGFVYVASNQALQNNLKTDLSMLDLLIIFLQISFVYFSFKDSESELEKQ